MTTAVSVFTVDERGAMSSVRSAARDMVLALRHDGDLYRVAEFMASELTGRGHEAVRGDYVPTEVDATGYPLSGEVVDVIVDGCLALLVTPGGRITAFDVERLTAILTHHPSISAGAIVSFTSHFGPRVREMRV